MYNYYRFTRTFLPKFIKEGVKSIALIRMELIVKSVIAKSARCNHQVSNVLNSFSITGPFICLLTPAIISPIIPVHSVELPFGLP